MKVFVLLSAFMALATTIGHFTIGYKSYVRPMLNADFDLTAKRVMLSVFHYMSVFLILTSTALLLIGFGIWNELGAESVVFFISVCYLGFACWQLVLAFLTPIPNAAFKMFQWVFFLLVALFAALGIS